MVGGSEPEMQVSMAKFSSAFDNFGLAIYAQRTEVMLQPVPHVPHAELQSTIKGQKLQTAEPFNPPPPAAACPKQGPLRLKSSAEEFCFPSAALHWAGMLRNQSSNEIEGPQSPETQYTSAGL